jgi:hypothetical protein
MGKVDWFDNFAFSLPCHLQRAMAAGMVLELQCELVDVESSDRELVLELLLLLSHLSLWQD